MVLLGERGEETLGVRPVRALLGRAMSSEETPMVKIRVTDDKDLATPEAMQFRIGQLRKTPNKENYGRILALRARLGLKPLER